MNILKVSHLTKKVNHHELLHDVNFEINAGDILAFIGPNGSGKTTTIKCILGLNNITSGDITINGYDIKKDYVKAISKVGCIVESPDVYMYLSGYENLRLAAMLYKKQDKKELDKIIKQVGLENRIHDKVSKYSLGMRERLGIAISLINNPNLLILDEPTNGLDPEGIKDLRELLISLAKTGIGILISSHNLSELESFCNKVCIISAGHVIEENSLDNLRTNDDNYLFKLNTTKGLKKLLNTKDVVISDNELKVIRKKEEIPTLINDLVAKNIKIYEVKKEVLTLEEAFIRKTGGNQNA